MKKQVEIVYQVSTDNRDSGIIPVKAAQAETIDREWVLAAVPDDVLLALVRTSSIMVHRLFVLIMLEGCGEKIDVGCSSDGEKKVSAASASKL